jgi:hypothetical protein
LVQVKVGYSQRVFSTWSNPEKKWIKSLFLNLAHFFEDGTKLKIPSQITLLLTKKGQVW